MRRQLSYFILLASSVLIGFAAAASRSQGDDAGKPIPDPVSAYPDNYTVLFEDERVRVLDFRLARGASEAFHRHPPNVAVFLGEFKIRFRLPDGKTALREAHVGDVGYSSEAVIHSPTNIGDTDAHGILIEFKQAAK
jgi:hypothetical protein